MSHEESFRAALRESGIEYSGPIYIDGKLHRIKADGDHSKNSWYVLYPGPLVAGAYGCWKRDLKETWCERNGSLSSLELELIRQRSQEASATLKAETVTRQKKARKVAAWILNRSRPAVSLHRYLSRKGVKVFGNLRVYRRLLVLPLCDARGELQSLQFIDGDGTKKFLKGGLVAGCFFTLADKADGLLVLCEGYVTGASIYESTGHAVICAMDSGNLLKVAKAARERWPQREIIIAADNDQFTDGNPGLTKATAAAKAIGAKLATPQFDDLANEPTDFNDLAIAQGLDAVREQVGSTQVSGEIAHEKAPQTQASKAPDLWAGAQQGETDEEAIARLAALPTLEYERVRETEAEKLESRVAILDRLVDAKRLLSEPANSGLQGRTLSLPDVEPWPEPVNGAEVLDQVADTFTKYIALPDGAADTLALWCTHAHVFNAFMCTARLNITSPEKQCGKTTLCDVVGTITPRPLPTENMSVAVLFRVVEKHKPTVLLDECDTWIKNNPELLSLINGGHRRGGQALRCEGENNEVRAFNVFAPAVLCGIGSLPGTAHDRSIVIRLARAKPGEIRARFDLRHTKRETELCRKLARFTTDNMAALESCDPKLPDGAFNRLADNWRPLFAIAEIAGSDWPERCAAGFAKLTSSADLDAQGVGTMLLADSFALFAAEKTDKLPSSRFAELLAAIEGRPWAEWGKHRKPISPNQLANQLKRFGVSPGVIRIGDETARGYLLDDFQEAFARYLPDPPFPGCNNVTMLGKTVIFEPSQGELVLHPEKAPFTRESYTVTPCKEEEPGKGDKNAETVIIDEHGVGRL